MDDLLIRYLQRQMLVGEQIMRAKTVDTAGKKLPTRTMIVLLHMYAKKFLAKSAGARRWVILPGLRGTGKTTLLAQLYLWLYSQVGTQVNLLYVSLDEVVEKVGSNLSDLLDEYEKLLPSGSFEELDRPTFLFIDEVQTDPSWARTLKFVFDRSPKVFILCSGSSATHLQLDADIDGRRAVTEKLFPLSFTEYQVLSRNVLPEKGLKKSLTDALYTSKSADEVYTKLADMKSSVDRQWTRFSRGSISTYLKQGTIPFTINEADTRLVYSAIDAMVDKIITLDLQSLKQFKSETIGAMKRLIFILTDCDVMPLDKLASAVVVSRGQLINMIDALVKAELLIKVPAHGSNVTATTNPSRYHFMSPAIRAAFHDIVGLPETVESREGKLLEDAAALHFYREFVCKKTGSLTHPFDKAGGLSDFVLRVANKTQIPIEFSMGQKNFAQVEKTLEKHTGTYGLIFSKSPLTINRAKTAVSVPLDYFFLI